MCSSSDWLRLREEKFSSTIVQSPSTIELVSVRSVAEPMLYSSPDKWRKIPWDRQKERYRHTDWFYTNLCWWEERETPPASAALRERRRSSVLLRPPPNCPASCDWLWWPEGAWCPCHCSANCPQTETSANENSTLMRERERERERERSCNWSVLTGSFTYSLQQL